VFENDSNFRSSRRSSKEVRSELDKSHLDVFWPAEVKGVTIRVFWLSMSLAFIVSCSTGLLFGDLPANLVARLYPTEALRYE
jgi:ABC-type antimicrobial peptide transport system permease subunit